VREREKTRKSVHRLYGQNERLRRAEAERVYINTCTERRRSRSNPRTRTRTHSVYAHTHSLYLRASANVFINSRPYFWPYSGVLRSLYIYIYIHARNNDGGATNCVARALTQRGTRRGLAPGPSSRRRRSRRSIKTSSSTSPKESAAVVRTLQTENTHCVCVCVCVIIRFGLRTRKK